MSSFKGIVALKSQKQPAKHTRTAGVVEIQHYKTMLGWGALYKKRCCCSSGGSEEHLGKTWSLLFSLPEKLQERGF